MKRINNQFVLGEELSKEKVGFFFDSGAINVGANSIEYKTNDSVGKESNGETEDSIKDGVLRIGDFFAVAT